MLLTSELDFACFLLPCLACILVTRGLVLRLASLIIETIQEHETRIEERGAECREQAGAPSSWLAGGPVQPSQPTLIAKLQQNMLGLSQQLWGVRPRCVSCRIPILCLCQGPNQPQLR